MNVLYRAHDPLPSAVYRIGGVFLGAAYAVCCLPSFYLIGHFALQMILSVLLSAVLTACVFCFVPRSLRMLSEGLSVFLIVMLAWCLYTQVRAQIEAGQFRGWIHTFFYDKPLTVAVVWSVGFVMILCLRLFLPYLDAYAQFREDYASFFSQTSKTFLLYYACVLIYCFILQRTPGGEPGLNLIPFSMIAGYISTFSYAYESIFYMIGNILCFFPLGFYYKVFNRNAPLYKYKLILAPIVLSLLIEISQLIFRMGDFDVDDILMNSLGFYVGCVLTRVLIWLRGKVTQGKESDIF